MFKISPVYNRRFFKKKKTEANGTKLIKKEKILTLGPNGPTAPGSPGTPCENTILKTGEKL